jgi:hypothetical protein
VVAVGGMNWSIRNGAFGKRLLNAVPVVWSVQVAGSGGEARLTSFCSRQLNGVPCWLTWTVCRRGAESSPRTPGQRP